MSAPDQGWLRCRFQANEDDYRPVKWPPPGPFWCSGYGGDDPGYSIVVAYVRTEDQVKEFWPEATNIDTEPREEIKFTDRFQKPAWWNEETQTADPL